MIVEQTEDDWYYIQLEQEQENIVSEWAHNSHISNEEVIDEWLSEAIQAHKPLKPTDNKNTEHEDEHCSI